MWISKVKNVINVEYVKDKQFEPELCLLQMRFLLEKFLTWPQPCVIMFIVRQVQRTPSLLLCHVSNLWTQTKNRFIDRTSAVLS